MPLYICRWQNGDFSAVYARSREDAIIKLDEVGNAEVAELFTTKDFMVHFKLREEWGNMIPVDLEGFGEDTVDVVCDRVYPVYQKAVMSCDDDWADHDHPTEAEWTSATKTLKEALITEKKRNWGMKEEQMSDDPDARRLQEKGFNIPRVMAERIVKDHREQKIEEMKNMPPTSDKLQ